MIIVNNIVNNSIDLTAPPTNIGTTTPPAITVSTLFRSANSGNAAFVAQPSGTGAFQMQVADNTVTGGNARGASAVDLQLERGTASGVASGSGSVISGGYNNIASGLYSLVIGGAYNTASAPYSMAGGNGCTASQYAAFSCGQNNIASGYFSFAAGRNASTKAVSSLFALGTEYFAGSGKGQLLLLPLAATTTSATPKVLQSDTDPSPVASNQLVLQNNSAIAFFGLAVATITGGGDTATWRVEGGIKRGANAASTALVGTPTITSIGANAGASAWTLAITADTTNGCLAATVTNGAGVTVRVNLSLFASEVAF